MTRKLVIAAAAISAAAFGLAATQVAQGQTQTDDGFANALWDQIASRGLVGPDSIAAVPYLRQGVAHGALLVTLVSDVTVEGITGQVIVKRSYTDEATRDQILADPDANVANVTVMFKRPGYDPENQDWFWAMYAPTGMIGAMDGMTMAGRVGMCASCHSTAPGGDYIFAY